MEGRTYGKTGKVLLSLTGGLEGDLIMLAVWQEAVVLRSSAGGVLARVLLRAPGRRAGGRMADVLVGVLAGVRVLGELAAGGRRQWEWEVE